jgi:aspartate/methionine/tyrosine aminotransferase
MVEKYNFETHIGNAHAWEARNLSTTRKLSDWNCGRDDPRVPTAILEAASQRALQNLTTYTETASTIKLGRQILDRLRSMPNTSFAENAAVHLYGNATQALFASLYAIRESLHEPKFLLIHPSYYATHDALNTLRLPYSQHWRKLTNSGEIDLVELDILWRKLGFDVILLTDPMYSTGIELSQVNFERTVAFARERDLWIMIDSAFSGLTWSDPTRRWLDLPKLQRCGYAKCILIDSPSKRLFTNNLKLGMVHCSDLLSQHLEKVSDSFTGNITGVQAAFTDSIFGLENQDQLQSICDDNVEKIIRNYEHLIELVNDSEHLHFIRPHSGFHTMLFSRGVETGSADAMAACAWLLEHGVFALPTNDYYYHDNDPFGFRLNLMKAPLGWQDIVVLLAQTSFR